MGKFDKKAVLSVASIHATVISILIGFGTAYIFYINNQINELETKALDIVEEVNQIDFSTSWLTLATPSMSFLESWSQDESKIQNRLHHYWIDPQNKKQEDYLYTHPPFKVYFTDYKLNHTELKLCMMGALVLRAPFPDRLVMKEGQHTGLAPSAFLSLSNMAEIDEWVTLVHKNFSHIYDAINWFGTEEFSQSFNWEEEINMHHKFYDNLSEGYTTTTLKRFRELPYDFCTKIEQIYAISRLLQNKLKRFNYLQKQTPTKATIYTFLILSISAFFAGVIIPMVTPAADNSSIVWVPLSFYFIFLVYISIKISTILY